MTVPSRLSWIPNSFAEPTKKMNKGIAEPESGLHTSRIDFLCILLYFTINLLIYDKFILHFVFYYGKIQERSEWYR